MKNMMKKYIYLLLYVYCCVLLVVLCYSLLLNLLLWPAGCLSHSIFCVVWSEFNFLCTSLPLTYRRLLSQKWVHVSPKGGPLIYLRLGWLCKFCTGWLVGHTIESVTWTPEFIKRSNPAFIGRGGCVFAKYFRKHHQNNKLNQQKNAPKLFFCLILRLIGWIRKWTLVLVESY